MKQTLVPHERMKAAAISIYAKSLVNRGSSTLPYHNENRTVFDQFPKLLFSTESNNSCNARCGGLSSYSVLIHAGRVRPHGSGDAVLQQPAFPPPTSNSRTLSADRSTRSGRTVLALLTPYAFARSGEHHARPGCCQEIIPCRDCVRQQGFPSSKSFSHSLDQSFAERLHVRFLHLESAARSTPLSSRRGMHGGAVTLYYFYIIMIGYIAKRL